ncbi:uncharacterized protein LOC119421163 [Nematolebias whitei]|uniref:uncharacterized protein LOC119421163 n=1 Tax=Nematolebias whitei TaxID=451745 RepID=UPI001898C424|nr:uncharacterized protein LOC119421163 [Nematolebias whitei]
MRCVTFVQQVHIYRISQWFNVQLRISCCFDWKVQPTNHRTEQTKRRRKMSLLCAVERIIKACKVEQAQLNENIQHFREILQSLTSQLKAESEESERAEAAADADASPGEKEDIDLLERALEKALRVRTGSEPSKDNFCRSNISGAQSETSPTTDVLISSAVANRASASPDPITLVNKKTARSNVARSDDMRRAAAVSVPPSNNTDGLGSSSLLQQNVLKSEETTKWKYLRSKQNGLWDKVISLQRKPVPGRSHFMERMRATFPSDWPRGSPDQTRALLDRLTEQGLTLAQRCQAEEVLAKQASAVETELGDKIYSDSCPTLERLQQTAAELQIFADQVKKEWKAWDRWRPEGGCLCPTGANCVLGDGMVSPLPLTISYRTEDELQELERLRMRVAQLQQEIQLEQVLLDTLSSQFSSIVSGPTCPSPSVLRDMYSLLGEGGERFPAIVLDSA